MLKLEDLKEGDKGRRVIYGLNNPNVETEQGIIRSWNKKCVFVYYARPKGDMNPEPMWGWSQAVAATCPEDLTFADEAGKQQE